MLLHVDRLSVSISDAHGPLPVVDGVDLGLDEGRTLALVGESGCGKSLTAAAIAGLLPDGVGISGGRIVFEQRDLLRLPPGDLRSMQGARIGMIFQEPMTALNPVLTIGHQVAEPLRVHCGLRGARLRSRTLELLRTVGIPSPERRAQDYAHQLSGGMRQRVLIAMALACEPKLLIADEPTTALDVTVQAQIIALLRSLQQRTGLAILFITHDLLLMSGFADAVSVMYAGRIVESAPTRALFARPAHPYTRALLAGVAPSVQPGGRLPVIPGEVPTPRQRPTGCAFHPRCDVMRGDETCRTDRPPLAVLGEGRSCACWHATA
ncbi:MAG: ABC transporter ATP-binding protein [Phycisphaerae bacterium]|jgi:oligopeptide/dipeptide ABC transporter ATP-binding protein